MLELEKVLVSASPPLHLAMSIYCSQVPPALKLRGSFLHFPLLVITALKQHTPAGVNLLVGGNGLIDTSLLCPS